MEAASTQLPSHTCATQSGDLSNRLEKIRNKITSDNGSITSSFINDLKNYNHGDVNSGQRAILAKGLSNSENMSYADWASYSDWESYADEGATEAK